MDSLNDKRKKDYESARNEMKKSLDEILDQRLIKKFHQLVVGDSAAHGYRTGSGSPRIQNEKTGKSVYLPPDSHIRSIETEMQGLLEYVKSLPNSSPIDMAARLHWGIVKIHPFNDGNGRVARLLVSWVLLNRGYDDATCRRLEEYCENKRKIYDAALDDGNITCDDFQKVSPKWYDYMHNALSSSIIEICLTKATSEQEWAAVRQFRHIYFFGPHNISDPYEWTFSHKDHYHFLLYKQEEIVGYAHVQLWLEKRSIIRIMVIDEPERGQGLGKQLVQRIEEWLVAQGNHMLCVDSRETSVGFYEKCGFTKTSFVDPEGYESDPNDTQMQKQLI